jgi:hypothetical protein
LYTAPRLPATAPLGSGSDLTGFDPVCMVLFAASFHRFRVMTVDFHGPQAFRTQNTLLQY